MPDGARSSHGLARLDNQLDAYPRAIDFLREVLRVWGARPIRERAPPPRSGRLS